MNNQDSWNKGQQDSQQGKQPQKQSGSGMSDEQYKAYIAGTKSGK